MTKVLKRKIYSVPGNTQRLDGGAMFGNAPRALWQRWLEPDDLNRIPLACRAMLISEDDRLILIEAGIGSFFPPKLRERYGIQESNHMLIENLESLGFSDKDIDVVVLSHMHFDHAGGLLDSYTDGQPHSLLFPKATFVISQECWNRARDPHMRDKASFVPELSELLEKTGRLELVSGAKSEALGPDYTLHRSNGHTPGLMMIEIPSKDGPILFPADLIPGVPWVHLPITMGYDRYPELLIEEKERRLTDLLENNGRIFFTHDPHIALARVTRNEHGKFGVAEAIEEVRGLKL